MKERTRAQESTGAIERLYISMRHLFSRGFYKPMGISRKIFTTMTSNTWSIL